MKDKMTNQTISGGFIFVIGMAMFTLLGGNYKKANTIWIYIYYSYYYSTFFNEKNKKREQVY